ncbi:MAG: hypothetical protein K5707_06105, partial [Clostridia bacterium]|nr:hypothetical protein [Clostridia bacterium]
AVIAYAQDIFTAHHYSNMKDLRFPPENPLGELDFTAFWFLLFPYDKGDDATAQAEGTPSGGAMDCLRQYLGIPDPVALKLFRLRSLRNKLEHNTPYFYCLLPEHRKLFHVDENDIFRYQYPEREAWEGQQILHDDALAIIADTIAPLDPGIYQAAEEVKARIHEDLRQLAVSGDQSTPTPSVEATRFSNYLNSILSFRAEYDNETRRFNKFEFLRAPIGAPLEGPAPWAELGEDLAALPWPSVAHPEIYPPFHQQPPMGHPQAAQPGSQPQMGRPQPGQPQQPGNPAHTAGKADAIYNLAEQAGDALIEQAEKASKKAGAFLSRFFKDH